MHFVFFSLRHCKRRAGGSRSDLASVKLKNSKMFVFQTTVRKKVPTVLIDLALHND